MRTGYPLTKYSKFPFLVGENNRQGVRNPLLVPSLRIYAFLIYEYINIMSYSTIESIVIEPVKQEFETLQTPNPKSVSCSEKFFMDKL